MFYQNQKERLNRIVRKVINRLNQNTANLINNSVKDIAVIWDNGIGSWPVNGRTIPLDKNETKFAVRLNVYTLRLYSDNAVIGVIVHEFGHVRNRYGKSKWRLFLEEKLVDIEKKADEVAISWGFSKEIKQMRKEARFYTISTSISDNQKSDNCDLHTKLKIVCSCCKAKFDGEYFNDILGKDSFIRLSVQGVPLAHLISNKSASDSKLIQAAKCFKCENGCLVVRKRHILFKRE